MASTNREKNFRLSFRMDIYRGFFQALFAFLGPLLVGRERWQETRRGLGLYSTFPPAAAGRHRLWFHAASVGELESLWPLVAQADEEGCFELILTVFSSSAWNHVHRMARSLPGRPPLFVGYSPLEGDWLPMISTLSPAAFITAKYEAWPEMWNALAENRVPLAIIGAKPRSSILWAKRILKLFAGKIPEIIFYTFDRENIPGLRSAFPEAALFEGSDPRWDRVFTRSERENPRIAELRQVFGDLPRPWGIMGSAWPSDLNRIPRDAFEKIPGTLWVVPHRLDARNLSEIEILLRERGWTPLRSGQEESVRPAGRLSPLIDEMGFLAELYSIMDWVWIGGGFGSSIHSTIEPAIYGLPITGGPYGRAKFDEIILLEKQAQLRIIEDSLSGVQVSEALQEISSEIPLETKKRWKELNDSHRGASRRIWADLRSRIV